MSLTDYIVGALYFTVTLGAAGAATWLLIRARLAWMALEARILAGALITTGLVALAYLLPLVLGVLTRGTAALSAALLLAAATRVRADPSDGPERPRGLPGNALYWAIGAVALLGSVGYGLAFLRAHRAVAIGDIDSTMFHLPGVASWIRSGSIWHANDFVPGWGFGAYPQTGNLLQLAVILPWHNDFLVRAVNPAFLVMGGLAVYAVAVELGAVRPIAATFAAVACTIPEAARVGLNSGMTDMPMAASLAAATLFLLRYARTGRRSELVLAGLGLGLTFGTKWYGPPDAAVVLVIVVLAYSRGREAIRNIAFVAGLTFAVGGFWLLRNLIIYGNPVFPARVHVLGMTIWDGPARTASTGIAHPLLHFATNTHVLRHWVWPQVVSSFGATGALLLIATVIAAVLAGRRRALLVAACAAGAFAILVVWVATPDSALEVLPGQVLVVSATRYALAAVLLGAAVTAWLAGSVNRAAVPLQALGLVSIADAIRRTRASLGVSVAEIVAATLVVALLGLLAWALITFGRPRTRSSAGLALGTLLLGVVVVAGGRKVEQDFTAKRYRSVEPAFDYLAIHDRLPQRVALAGLTGRSPYSSPIVAFGPRFENDVTYIGRRDHHLLARYESSRPFVDALRAGRYNLLLVGDHDRELNWARAVGWEPITIDLQTAQGFALLRAPTSSPARIAASR